ncbi:MAG: ribosome silencing factor [Bacillota bacterium]
MTKIQLITEALDDIKLKDITVYDMREKSPFFDYFILSTASNTRQLKASINQIKEALSNTKYDIKSIEGATSDSWILIDTSDIIINIFTEQERHHYNIEKMWMDIDTIPIDKL